MDEEEAKLKQTTADVQSVMLEETKNADGIDESLYSRQLYVMGRDAQKRMSASNVLLLGLNGLGVEIAKNIILAGVKSLTIVDPTLTTMRDLGSQFYLSEEDVGKPRANRRSIAKLAELNQYVRVSLHKTGCSNILENTEEQQFVSQFQVVVMVDQTLKSSEDMDTFCHTHDIAFIAADVRGLFASVFCDFGPEFHVLDVDGEQPITCMIADVSRNEESNESARNGNLVITVTDESRHHLETGDLVTFRELDLTLSQALGDTPAIIRVTGPYSFELENTSNITFDVEHATSKGGYVTQVKQTKVLHFDPLTVAWNNPKEFLISDFAKMHRPGLCHLAFRALSEECPTFPRPGNPEDAVAFVTKCHQLNDNPTSFGIPEDQMDDQILTRFSMGASATLAPMCAMLGGVVGQEVLKACSHKFTPLHQFLYFDAAECLPTSLLDEQEYLVSEPSRYADQIAVFGKEVQAKLAAQTLFLVGAGAIGCEMLKNWAMMGIACSDAGADGRTGTIHITDMDIIEKSNLNRQFLFRPKDVQKPKSSTAASAAQVMSPSIQVLAQTTRVGPETEDVFDDSFFESLDGVVTALDNMDARLYVDSKCLFYKKPMFESGTLGTKGNTQLVLPHLSEPYGASRDPPEKSIPICTLKNFPHSIEHTLPWARDYFEGTFCQMPTNVNAYLSRPDFLSTLASDQHEMATSLEQSLVSQKPVSFRECLKWARIEFQELFGNQIRQLLYNFPADQVTSSGAAFWTGPKRAPVPLDFDLNDPVHLDFVIAAANMRAENYGLVGHRDLEVFRQELPHVHVPAFEPKGGVKIAQNDAELEAQAERSGSEENQSPVVQRLPSPSSLAGYRLCPVDFDKDNDRHMELIVATSNLRARNYKIEEADMHQSRFIAGKIIPAIATTTALVTGLICLEMYKVAVHGFKNVEVYKNGFVNIALPLLAFSEPVAPVSTVTQVKGQDMKWTPWDNVDMTQGDLTLKEFLAYFQSEYGMEVSMISYGVSILYAEFSSQKKIRERMGMKMSEIATSVSKKSIPPSARYIIFEVCGNDVDDYDLEIELPCVRYRL